MIVLRRPRSKSEWVALIAGAVFVWFSGVALFMGLQSYLWPKAPGVITYSTSVYHPKYYEVGLRYTYKYQNQEYTGTRYRFRFWFFEDRGGLVDSVQARYKVGEPVNVSINPRNPSDAVLEPGIEFESFLVPAFGLLLIFGGVAERRGKTAQPAAEPQPARRYGTAAFLLFAGLALLLYGSNTLYKAWSSLSWPTADGKILESTSRAADGSYRTQLWYEYQVQGTRHVSENYHTGGNSTVSEDTARAVAKRYPEGSSVKVYYSPSNPSESVLEPGPWFGNFIFPAISLVILLAAWVAKKLADVRISRQKPRN